MKTNIAMSLQLQASEACLKNLKKGKILSVDQKISCGIVSLCIELLKLHYSSDQLRYEACDILINVAAGTSEQTQYVIKEGAIPPLVKRLKSSCLDVVEQTVWVLGNIAGDGPEARDLVLEEGAFPLLIQLVTPETSALLFIRNIVWALSNLCRNPNLAPTFEMTFKDILPLSNRLLDYSDTEVLRLTCYILAHLTNDHNEQMIQAVIESGVVPKLIKLLNSPEIAVLAQALRTVGNIATGNDSQTDTVVAHGALRFLRDLLYHKKMNIAKDAAWTISNVALGTVQQIQGVIDADVVTPLIEVMHGGDLKSKKEAAWVIKNMTSKGTVFQIAHLIQKRIFKPLCDLLALKDRNIVLVVLDGIKNILSTAEKVAEVGRVALMIIEVGGLKKLQFLLKHEDIEIQQKAASMIDSYFSIAGYQNVIPVTKIENYEMEF